MKAGRFRLLRRQAWNWLCQFLPARTGKGISRHLPGVYLQGHGVEVGALADPLRVPPAARVTYLDRFSVEGLRAQYPTLRDVELVPVGIVADGEHLTGVADEAHDFIIARHFLEHCQDPIGTLKNFFRILKPGGIVYLTIPDKRYTFDKPRAVTSLAHLWQDHSEGPGPSRREHFVDYVRAIEPALSEDQVQARADELLTQDYSIHFHVWTQHEFLELLLDLRSRIGFDIETFCKNRHEMVCVLRKDAAAVTLEAVPAPRRKAA